MRHELLDEGGVRLVDQPLAFGGNRAKDQGRLAGPGDTGKDSDLALGDVERDVLEVVLAGTANFDRPVCAFSFRHRSLAPSEPEAPQSTVRTARQGRITARSEFRVRRQPTAFLTRAVICFSSAGPSLSRAHEVGHMLPSSRAAL